MKTILLFLFFVLYINTNVVYSQASPLLNAKYDLHVKGNLRCAEYPAATVRVRLWKNNEKSVLNETYVDKSGNFELTSSTVESNFDPIIVVYHDCNDGVKPGQRKFKFQVPKHYINFSKDQQKVFDLGTFNLETVLKYNEERQQYVDKRRRRTIHKSPRVDDLKKLEEVQTTRRGNKRNHSIVRRHKCEQCEIELKTTTTASSNFRGLDEEIDDRNDPW